MTRKETAARRLSSLARSLYAAAGVHGAYVSLTDDQLYRLVEDQNSIHTYRRAAECEAAIRASARQFRYDAR